MNRHYTLEYQLPLAAPKNYYAFQFVELMETHIRKLQRVQDYASLLKISRITLNHSVMAQYGLSAETATAGRNQKRTSVHRQIYK